MVTITSKWGEKFEVTVEMAEKFLRAWDISWYETEWEFVSDVEIIPEEPKRRKNIIRNPK